MTRTLYLPLKLEDITDLMNGEVLTSPYHVDDWKAIAVVHADGDEDVPRSEVLENARREGYDIINVPLDFNDLAHIQRDDAGVMGKYNGEELKVLVASQKAFDELAHMKKEEEASK